jgi:CspA family cold shock protein
LGTGKVLQFDHVRGYGFVAAEDGGEDIFLHASVFDEDPELLRPGMRVEFEVMNGDRGRKAFAAHLIEEKVNGNGRPLPPGPGLAVPAQEAEGMAIPPPEDIAGLAADAAPAQSDSAGVVDEEQLCDVLSPEEFRHALTELLLASAPALTGQQILDVRQSLLGFAQQHGWSDG